MLAAFYAVHHAPSCATKFAVFLNELLPARASVGAKIGANVRAIVFLERWPRQRRRGQLDTWPQPVPACDE